MYSKSGSYNALSLEIFDAESFGKGGDPEAELTSITLSIKFHLTTAYISQGPTGRVLIKFPRFMEMKLDCPQPVPPFRVAYISRPELLELPETERKKKEQEDLLLSQLLIGSSWNDLYIDDLTDGTGKQPPVEYEFNTSRERLREAGELSIWTDFASRTVFDIEDVLGGDVECGYVR